MEDKKFKSGFVAIVGKPNVGKSTLLNSLIGQKISITGPKAQTTRNKIMGIKTTDNYQIVYLDTPGAIKPKSKLDEFMKKSIESAMDGIDALVVTLDVSKITEKDLQLLDSYKHIKAPIVVVLNKCDQSAYEKAYPMLAKLNELKYVKEFVSVSALTGKNVDELEKVLCKYLPEGEPLFDRDQVTDRTERFLAAEIIREKALLNLREEIPHGLAIDVVEFKEGKRLVQINAEIVTAKDNHKQIIIGKNGEMLKKIGIQSREDIEKMLGKRVNLQLFVKVRAGWQDNNLSLREFGYDKKDV